MNFEDVQTDNQNNKVEKVDLPLKVFQRDKINWPVCHY